MPMLSLCMVVSVSGAVRSYGGDAVIFANAAAISGDAVSICGAGAAIYGGNDDVFERGTACVAVACCNGRALAARKARAGEKGPTPELEDTRVPGEVRY
eukprot:2251110-Rhodomonas_salina.2